MPEHECGCCGWDQVHEAVSKPAARHKSLVLHKLLCNARPSWHDPSTNGNKPSTKEGLEAVRFQKLSSIKSNRCGNAAAPYHTLKKAILPSAPASCQECHPPSRGVRLLGEAKNNEDGQNTQPVHRHQEGYEPHAAHQEMRAIDPLPCLLWQIWGNSIDQVSVTQWHKIQRAPQRTTAFSGTQQPQRICWKSHSSRHRRNRSAAHAPWHKMRPMPKEDQEGWNEVHHYIPQLPSYLLPPVHWTGSSITTPKRHDRMGIFPTQAIPTQHSGKRQHCRSPKQ